MTMIQPLTLTLGTFLLLLVVCCGTASTTSNLDALAAYQNRELASIQMNIDVLHCPETLIQSPDKSYEIIFQVLNEAQEAAGAGIIVTFLTDDNFPDLSPREAQTNDIGQVSTMVLPLWQNQQTQQTIVVGAMLLPQRIGTSCSTQVRRSF